MTSTELRRQVGEIVALERQGRAKRRLARKAWSEGYRHLSGQYSQQAADRFAVADALRERLRLRVV